MFPIKEIDVNHLSDLTNGSKEIEIIDIRTPAEVARGVIPQAKTLPMHLIPLNLDYFSSTGKEIVIYCRTGSRSAQACMFLKQQGIDNVLNLRGGIVSWASGGHPIEPAPSGGIN